MIGAPISGLAARLDGVHRLKGWQWLFLLEGMPSVLLGIVTWFYLTDRPAKATWLSAEQKRGWPRSSTPKSRQAGGAST